MNNNDTVDKIVQTYFACVTNEPFEYKGKIYEPKKLNVSPLIFRGFTCPASCGGCCFRVTLDWLPEEAAKWAPKATPREITLNNKQYTIHSDLQDDHDGYKCKNLRLEDGRCNIHGKHPFTCDFELMKFMVSGDPDKHNLFIQKLFGRGWNLKRVDGERGALCEMTPVDLNNINEVIRKLNRLHDWCNHFELNTKVPTIIEWAHLVKNLTNYDILDPLKLLENGSLVGIKEQND